MFLLRHRRPHRFGKWIERMLTPEPSDSEPAYRLAGHLDEIEWSAPEQDGNEDCPE